MSFYSSPGQWKYGGSITHTVNISLPYGTAGAVNAATANDAENLYKLLSRLSSTRRSVSI
ncbi:hypothetical protein [Pseudacidovorax intermedius]|uniref:hypothetical protein n=1 Tax=Pseudacidovorax intermedius TaxID=433924 RepID=UPI0026F0F381|nr:hypothetical protein [Pseudacidovorax intermedius]